MTPQRGWPVALLAVAGVVLAGCGGGTPKLNVDDSYTVASGLADLADAVPLTGKLRELLAQHGLDTGRTGDDLVFGRTADQPFVPTTIRARALKAWKAAGLEQVVLHEARHTFASFLIDAQVNPLALTKMIGHTDHRFTMRQYGHLFPDSDEIAAGQLDAYLSAS